MVAGSARRLIRAGAVVLSCAVLSGACGSRPKESASQLNPPGGLGLRPVTLPDFSGMEASVREQMRARSSSLTATIERPENAADLGAAYGELGKLLMAATYFDAAEVCYRNRDS